MGHERRTKNTNESVDLDIIDLSTILRNLVICWPISPQYLRFETNICKFCTLVTGNAGVGFQDVFKVLRDYLTWQKQQWTPIYKQIREQGAELARRQRVITCLGFRHVLETLPDQLKILAEFPGLTGNFGATGIWRLTWQLVLEQKLIMMLQERVSKLTSKTPIPSTALTALKKSPSAASPILVTTSTSSIAASSTSATSSTSGLPSTPVTTSTASSLSSKSAVSPGIATTKPPSDPLREILQYDFEYWISNLKRGKAGNIRLTTNASRINAEHQRLTNPSTSTAAGVGASVASRSSASGSNSSASKAKGTTSTATGASPAAAASSSAASTSGPTTGEKKSTYTQLFIDLDLDYASWNGFQRGIGLYSELSGSIHKYSQTFEAHETDCARTDWLVLQWLKPEQNANGEVVWNDTRKRIGLPFTP